ncbi:MAG TPA: IclR family transcriptional regulator, partial [Dehalococcoidia bacterium]|nr:IclR family transcriptional regulator [Dehalococcoidia bacterium]
MGRIEEAARLLDLFWEGQELGVREMARRLGMSKSAVHRLAVELERVGFLFRDPETGRYRLGLRLLQYGGLFQLQSELVREALPVLRSLLRVTGETVHLAALEGGQVVYLVKLESANSISMPSWVGWRNPAHCTAVGKALLAYQDRAEVEATVAKGLRRFTPNTIVEPERLLEHLRQVRQRGLSFDQEERRVGLRCVGAPVLGRDGEAVASISV